MKYAVLTVLSMMYPANHRQRSSGNNHTVNTRQFLACVERAFFVLIEVGKSLLTLPDFWPAFIMNYSR